MILTDVTNKTGPTNAQLAPCSNESQQLNTKTTQNITSPSLLSYDSNSQENDEDEEDTAAVAATVDATTAAAADDDDDDD